MTESYRKGEYVRYSCNGVCLVDDIRMTSLSRKDAPKEFYILKPVSNPSSTIFVPTGSPALVAKMARLPTREELDQLILSTKDEHLPWVDDRKVRLANFQAIIKACDLRELLCLISCIYQRKQSLLHAGKKLGGLRRGHPPAGGGSGGRPGGLRSASKRGPGESLSPRKTPSITPPLRQRRKNPRFPVKPGIFSILFTASSRRPARHSGPGRAGGGRR